MILKYDGINVLIASYVPQCVVPNAVYDALYVAVISLSDASWVKEKLQAHEVALVMLDLNLGEESGAVLCEYIKGQDDLKHISVILVSANMDIETIKDQCGADDLIKKPFELDHFVSKVHAHTQTAE